MEYHYPFNQPTCLNGKSSRGVTYVVERCQDARIDLIKRTHWRPKATRMRIALFHIQRALIRHREEMSFSELS